MAVYCEKCKTRLCAATENYGQRRGENLCRTCASKREERRLAHMSDRSRRAAELAAKLEEGSGTTDDVYVIAPALLRYYARWEEELTERVRELSSGKKPSRAARWRAMLGAALALVLLSGSDCEIDRLAKLDHGYLDVDGCQLYQGVVPFVVYVDPFELDEDQIATIEDAVLYAESLAPGTLQLVTEMPAYHGVATIEVSALPAPLWDEPGPGGVAIPEWDSSCGIVHCAIVIDYAHAYDLQTLRDRTLHELGHCPYGLAHDESSIDLGSCMSSPPEWDCDYTEADAERMQP